MIHFVDGFTLLGSTGEAPSLTAGSATPSSRQ